MLSLVFLFSESSFLKPNSIGVELFIHEYLYNFWSNSNIFLNIWIPVRENILLKINNTFIFKGTLKFELVGKISIKKSLDHYYVTVAFCYKNCKSKNISSLFLCARQPHIIKQLQLQKLYERMCLVLTCCGKS